MPGLLTGARAASSRPGLEPRRSTWGWSATTLLAFSMIAAGVLLLNGSAALAVMAASALVLAAFVVGLIGIRHSFRARLTDRLVEALGPMLGSELDRRILRADRWSRFWGGIPSRIRLRYGTGTGTGTGDVAVTRWRTDLQNQLVRRLGVPFDIGADDQKNCVLELTRSLIPDAITAARDASACAERWATRWAGIPDPHTPALDRVPAPAGAHLDRRFGTDSHDRDGEKRV